MKSTLSSLSQSLGRRNLADLIVLNGLLGAICGPLCILFFMWIMQMAFLAHGFKDSFFGKGTDDFMKFMFFSSSPASFFAAATASPWLIRRLIKHREASGKNSMDYCAGSGLRFGFFSLFIAIFYLGMAMIAVTMWRGEFQKDIFGALSQALLFIFLSSIGLPLLLTPGILLIGSFIGILNDFLLRKIPPKTLLT